MKKTFLKIVEKFERIPFFRKTVRVVSVSAGAIEIKDAFLIASNSTLPVSHRAIAAVKGSCCTGALITSYFATHSPTPGLEATFKVCCGFFSAGYLVSGGDTAIALSYLYNTTKIK
jgi:hypothetical protein